jgi:hypothetical protein
LCRRVLESAWILGSFVLAGTGPSAWSQENLPTAPLPVVHDSASGASQAQKPAAEALLPGSIFGIVVSKDGEEYEGVRVTLSQTGHGAPPARTQITGSDGGFRFAGVAPGAFKLTISTNGFVTQAVSGVLHPGEMYNAQTVVLPVAIAASEVRVTASQTEIAVEQFHEEEQQRVLGVIPNFYVSYVPDAPPLTVKEKFSLAWRTSFDPITLLAAGAFAGVEQASNTYSGYGQGAQGYGKRFGASYADSSLGNLIGGAILPIVFKQDPRYFYKGTGTVRSRTLYAMANAVICKGDNGHWQGNYSGILGSLAAGGISNLYYPADDRNGVGLTFENTAIGIAGSAVQNLFQEFVVRKLTPRVPHYKAATP